MTASLLERPVAAVGPVRRARMLPEGWPLYILLYGYPLWWFLGLQAFIWPLVAIPMALALLKQRSTRIPKGFGIYLVFLFWMFGSALQLSGSSRVLAYLYRGSLYVSAAILLLYLINRPKDRVTSRSIVNGLASLWAVTVMGGFAGILFPHVQFSSVTEKLLPGSLAHNAFVYSLVHPGFADTTDLLGFALARPKAPFNYTNEWGSNLAILTPFAVYALILARRQLWRWAIAVGLVASVVPIVLSINRGLWISLGVGVLYVAIRVGLRGNLRVLLGTLATIAVAAGVVVTTPLGNVVLQRIAHPNTQGRAYLYQQATDSAMESPLLGHGAPVSSSSGVAAGASVGTHGQLWTLLVSQGFPGLFLFVAFFVMLFIYTWRVSNRALWAHAAMLVALTQMPVYNWLPVQINLVMLAAVVCWLEVTAGAPPRPGEGTAPTVWTPAPAGRRLWRRPRSKQTVAALAAGSALAGGPALAAASPEAGTDAELRKMARGGTFNLVAVAWMGVASFVLVVVLTRGLGPTGYGLVATAIAAFTLLSNVGELGADTGLLREIPRLLVQRRARDARAVLRVSLIPVLITGVVMAALVYIYAPQLTHILVRHTTNQDEVTYLRILTPFLAIAPAATVALAGTRGFGNLKIFALVQNIFVPSVRPIAAGAVLLAGLGGMAVVFSWGAPLAVALVAALFYLFRFVRRAERGPAGQEEPRPTGVVAREFWSFTAARGVAGALAIAVTQVNLLLVSGLRSAHDAGVFSAVMRYVIMGTFAFQAMRVAIGPQIARLLAEQRDRDAETVFQTATWWLMALSWPLYLLLGVFASTVLGLFGHGFTSGATALAILCAAELIDMGTGNVTLVLLMGGRSKWNLINISLGLVTTVGLGVLLIPHYGVVGAAIAWAATIIIENGAAAVQVGFFMKMRPFGSGYAYVTLAALACFLGLGVIARVVGLPGPAALAATVVVGGIAYLAVLHRFRARLRLDLLARTLLRRGPGPLREAAV